jgi:VWFA-related protein
MRLWGFPLAAGLLATAWAAGQNPAPPSRPDDTIRTEDQISVYVNRVNMLFTVMDHKGRFVTGLGKENFELIEDKRPQTIQEFSAETDLPLRLGILIDTSNSIRDRFKFEQEAASQFVRSVMRSELDRGMVISFDSTAQLISDLSGDPGVLQEAIAGLRPGGGTALYDAIYFACRDKLALDQPKSKFRRAIVILSDGEDNQSHFTRDQALEMAQRADTVVFTISTNVTRAETDGDKVLKYFAEKTGGRAYFPFKVEDLEQSFEDIHNELNHQYIILYRPDPLKTDGLFHTFELRVKGRKDLLVRVRPGYYAPRM